MVPAPGQSSETPKSQGLILETSLDTHDGDPILSGAAEPCHMFSLPVRPPTPFHRPRGTGIAFLPIPLSQASPSPSGDHSSVLLLCPLPGWPPVCGARGRGCQTLEACGAWPGARASAPGPRHARASHHSDAVLPLRWWLKVGT